MSGEDEIEPGRATALRSVEMLRAVVAGETYDVVAARSGVTRTAVERRIKVLAGQLCRRVGIEGLNPDAAAFVQRLRDHRGAILAALDQYDPPRPCGPRASRVVSDEEVARGALRIKGRSNRPWHDQALFYLLFATGARPLEIARLEVRDYLNADGTVRVASEVRPDVAITGRPRAWDWGSRRPIAGSLRRAACSCRRPGLDSRSRNTRRRGSGATSAGRSWRPIASSSGTPSCATSRRSRCASRWLRGSTSAGLTRTKWGCCSESAGAVQCASCSRNPGPRSLT
jgi:integrase